MHDGVLGQLLGPACKLPCMPSSRALRAASASASRQHNRELQSPWWRMPGPDRNGGCRQHACALLHARLSSHSGPLT
jgi:hypothetical protein